MSHMAVAFAMTMTLLGSDLAFAAPQRLYACGDSEIREYRIDGPKAVETWRWTATTASDLPKDYQDSLMATIDDCKPVDGGHTILATSSTGGVALIDRRTSRVLFRAKVPNAHSADMLPDGRIAVALSVGAGGDKLMIFDRRQIETPISSVTLASGHGVVWDKGRQRIFALSRDLVQSFVLEVSGINPPSLREMQRWALPGSRDGHDLSLRHDGQYFVTTDDGVWIFDPDTAKFSAFAALNPESQVKSIGLLQNQLAWVKATENWWAHGFTLMDLKSAKRNYYPVPGIRLYKVRWQ
jgi:hypothetical protein